MVETVTWTASLMVVFSVEHAMADLLAASLMVNGAVSWADAGSGNDRCWTGLQLHCRLGHSWTVSWSANSTAGKAG